MKDWEPIGGIAFYANKYYHQFDTKKLNPISLQLPYSY